MNLCEYCGGNIASGCGPTEDGRIHYSKIDCAEVLKALVLQAREIGHGFRAAPGSAIIHHNENCTFYRILLTGARPKNDDACDCQAKPTGKKLLAFMLATKVLEA